MNRYVTAALVGLCASVMVDCLFPGLPFWRRQGAKLSITLALLATAALAHGIA